MIEKAQDILQKQKKNLAILAIGIGIFILGVGYLASSNDHSSQTPTSHSAIALPGDKVNAQELWMSQIESQNKMLESQSKLLEQKIEYLQGILLNQTKKEEDNEKEKQDLKRELGRFKRELASVSERANQIAILSDDPSRNIDSEIVVEASHDFFNEANQALKSPTISSNDPFQTVGTQFHKPNLENHVVEPIRPPLSEVSMGQEGNNKKKTEHIDEKIFAGTTVKALLVSSVDAVCGVFANSDPVPVKLRLLDNAHLPKHLIAKLKGALIIGSAYGNLSNERVYIRLERMTLFNSKSEGIEMEVAGYVSGEDGRFGLRGIVIDKSTKIVKNAAFSGFLSGTGQILQSAVSKRPVDCWNNYAVGSDILKQGCATGAGNAFDMLADYYIKRAEQVQPVVQVNAGRVVDITFTYGASLGDIHVKDKIKELRLRNR